MRRPVFDGRPSPPPPFLPGQSHQIRGLQVVRVAQVRVVLHWVRRTGDHDWIAGGIRFVSQRVAVQMRVHRRRIVLGERVVEGVVVPVLQRWRGNANVLVLVEIAAAQVGGGGGKSVMMMILSFPRQTWMDPGIAAHSHQRTSVAIRGHVALQLTVVEDHEWTWRETKGAKEEEEEEIERVRFCFYLQS